MSVRAHSANVCQTGVCARAFQLACMLMRCMHVAQTPDISPLEDFLKFASNVGGVAIHDGCVTVLDGSRVVQDDDLR